MAQRQGDPPLIVDGISALDAGMNSGVVPQSLPPNQTAFSTNASHRDGYIRPRPPITKQKLNFGTDLLLPQRMQQGVFQGCCYFQSEYGEQGFVASIGGRIIFFVVPLSGAIQVRDVTPKTSLGADDPNSSGNPIAWLWQSERWMIINDGQSLPIFFDGQVARRSFGSSQLLGILGGGGFTAPAVGASLDITLAAPYSGPTNILVTIGTSSAATYQLNSSNAGYKVTLQNVGDFSSRAIPAGTQLSFPTNLVGQFVTSLNLYVPVVTSQLVSLTGPGLGVGGGGGSPPPTITITYYGFPTSEITPNIQTGGVGNGTIFTATTLNPSFTAITYSTGQFSLTGSVGAAPATNAAAGPYVTNLNTGNTNLAFKGAGVYLGFPNFTNPLNLTLVNSLTAPAFNTTVDVVINKPYNGALGAIVSLGGGLYKVVASNNTPVPSTTVNVTNIGDAPLTVHNPGEEVRTIPEMPVSKMGVYGLGRNWVCLPDGRSFIASDIVGGSSGTPAVNNRDSVLRFTENTFLNGGGTFVVPGNVGDIRAMIFTANLDTSLGQGPLQVGTSTTIFSCQAPVDRTTWSAVTNPILTESLKGKGPLGQYGTILVNSDTMFRSVDGISSLIIARRDFDVWGNVPISREMQRVIDADNESLLPNSTAVQFDNRVLYGCLPQQGPLGVLHTGVIALNLDPISSLRGKSPSIYDGLWTGLNIFLFVADSNGSSGIYNGVQRCFAFVYNTFLGQTEVWELEADSENKFFDNGTTPICWSFETGSKFINIKEKGQFDPVKLEGGEIYLSNLRGQVNVQAWYKPDYSNCWIPWANFDLCANNTESSVPSQQRTRLGLGTPSIDDCDPTTDLPYRIGRNFQFRFQITGFATFMGGLFQASRVPETDIGKPQCDPVCDLVPGLTPCEPCRDQGNCLIFPFIFYNLSNNKTYANQLMGFQVPCPDGTTREVFIEAGTITYTLPFPVGFAGPYPPLVMGCGAGGLIVRAVPDGATQDQIDAIVNDMIFTCAQSEALAQVDCTQAQMYPNGVVFFPVTCGVGETLAYTGSLPSWITLDVANSRLVGAAGKFLDTSQAQADTDAQNALNAFGTAELGNGHLHCQSACPGFLICQTAGIASTTKNALAVRPADNTIWTADNPNFGNNLYVVSGDTLTTIQTIDLTAHSGGQQIIYDSVNDQMAIICYDFSVVFINPTTYALTALALPITQVSLAPIAYDQTRGHLLIIDVQNGGGADKLVLVNGATHSIITSVTSPNPGTQMGSPVYVTDQDCFYFTFQGDNVVKKVDPTTLAISDSALSLPIDFGFSNHFALSWKDVPSKHQLYVNSVGILRTTDVYDSQTSALLGTLSGADVNWTFIPPVIEYDSCDDRIYTTDTANVLQFETAGFTETHAYPAVCDTNANTMQGMAYNVNKNAIWYRLDASVNTPCPPV